MSLLVKMLMRLWSWTMRRGAFQTEGSSYESRSLLNPTFEKLRMMSLARV